MNHKRNFEIPFQEALRAARGVTECGMYKEGEHFCYYAQGERRGHVWSEYQLNEVKHAALGEFQLVTDDRGLVVKAR